MKLFIPLYLIFFIFLSSCMKNNKEIMEDKDLLENLMKSEPEKFAEILQNRDKYETQIIYTQINRDSNNVPSFKSFYYNFDHDRYFYPASTVKMPAAFLALEKLNELGIDGLDKYSEMLIDSAFSGQSPVSEDTTSASGMPTIAHYIKKIFLVSDNDAFNRLYEFLGQETINRKLHQKGYIDSRIIHRLSIPLSEEENRHTNPLTFKRGGAVVYQQPLVRNDAELPLKGKILKGKGYLKGGNVVNEPMDFGLKNHIPLDELQLMLRAAMFPQSVSEDQRFNLTNHDYRFLYRYMSQLPAETTFPAYDTTTYYEAYSKFLMFGEEKASVPRHIRIFNKIGLAYGYMIDNAYIVDFKNRTEFMLSAVIHTNANEIYNDGDYEYEQVALPFMQNLGQMVYRYELNRKKDHLPDLSEFMTGYDKVVAAGGEVHADLYQNYPHYHLPELDEKRIKRADLEPFIDTLKSDPVFEVSKVGESVEGREINLIKAGSGKIKVMLWSQMHGDESTATRALFELFKFLSAHDALDSVRKKILRQTTLYFMPMLNPDGAEQYARRNALSFDLNRDALRLVSPESKILKNTRDRYAPDFGFNLHDQSIYYNIPGTALPASISFLAPAYNYEKEINETRSKAMKVIVSMNKALQAYIPGQVGKYDDSFEPRAFGDNIQKWGTSAILIESGGYPEDPEKKYLVRLNFVAILTALVDIADGTYANHTEEAYYRIPENDRKLFDLLIRNAKIEKNGQLNTTDVGIFFEEMVSKETGAIYYKSVIADMGDLSTYYGYQEIDASEMTLSPGRVYPNTLTDYKKIDPEEAIKWLSQGYTTIRLKAMPAESEKAALPLRLVPEGYKNRPSFTLDDEAYLLLERNGKNVMAICNERIISLNN